MGLRPSPPSANNHRSGSKLYVFGNLPLPRFLTPGAQLLNRRTPFGHVILDQVAKFPQYHLQVAQKSVKSHQGQGPVEVTLEIQCGLDAELPKPQQKKGKGRMYEMTSVLTVTSDNTFVDYRRIPYVHLQGVAFAQVLTHCVGLARSRM